MPADFDLIAAQGVRLAWLHFDLCVDKDSCAYLAPALTRLSSHALAAFHFVLYFLGVVMLLAVACLWVPYHLLLVLHTPL